VDLNNPSFITPHKNWRLAILNLGMDIATAFINNSIVAGMIDHEYCLNSLY
jgi:hypothetical protein